MRRFWLIGVWLCVFPSLSWGAICFVSLDRPSTSTVRLAWETTDATPDTWRVDRLNTATNRWVALASVPGDAREVVVPLASSGRRTYRLCAVATTETCLTHGLWVQR